MRAMLLLTAFAAPLLGACGQKGPLYLPGDPSEIQTEIPPEPADPRPQSGPDEADERVDEETDDDDR